MKTRERVDKYTFEMENSKNAITVSKEEFDGVGISNKFCCSINFSDVENAKLVFENKSILQTIANELRNSGVTKNLAMIIPEKCVVEGRNSSNVYAN